MRIAVLTRHFSRLAGGAESYAVAVVAELSTRHEMHVYTQQSDEPVAGVHYHYLPGWGKRLRWLNQLVFAICSWWMTRRGFDVVHAHENTWHGQVQTIHVRPMRLNVLVGPQGWRRWVLRLRVVLSPRLWTHLALESARFRSRKGLVVAPASVPLSLECARAYPQAKDALQVVAPGCVVPSMDDVLQAKRPEMRIQRKLTRGVGDAKRLILFVANDYRRKGLDTLLAALVDVPGCHLAVVGSERPIAEYKAIAQRLGVDDRVHFWGPQSDMREIYHSADLLVHPTLEDSYGMVVLEAMAHGLPVIVSGADHCGISRDLRSEEQALILNDPLDVMGLAATIQRFERDAELQGRLSSQGRRFAEAHSWESVGRKYEALYQRAVLS